MKAQWDWRVACLTRPGTQPPDPEGVATLLAVLAERCGRDGFRFVFPGDRKTALIAYRVPSGNGNLQDTFGVLAEAANLKLEPATTADWPEPPLVHQLAEPGLETDVPKTIRTLTEKTSVVFAARGGQVFQAFVAWTDELIELAAGFRVNRLIRDGGRIFVPGLRPRGVSNDGVTLADFALGFHLDQFEPEISPVSVQVGTSETGSPVFVDAGVGHVLILGPEKSTVGPRIGNQLALKAVQAKQIVVVVQPRKGMDLGPLSEVGGITVSTQMDERTIAAWQSQVLVGPGLSIVQGHPGGDALEALREILKGLWTATQMESRREGWPGVTIAVNDFIPTVSEPSADSTDRRLLSPYRHRLYEVLAQMAGGFDAIRLVLLGRPSVVFGVEHLRAVIGSFGQIVRLRTVAEGYPPGEGFSHNRYEDEEIRQWLHAQGAHGRALVLGPEGWVKTKLEVVEPAVEVVAEPAVQILQSEDAPQPHRWPAREQRQPAAQPPSVTVEALAASVSATDLERLLKARGILPLRPHEREALEDLKKPKTPVVVKPAATVEVLAAEPKPAVSPAPPAKAPPQQAPPMKEVTAAAGVGRPRPEEPKPEPRLTRSEEKLLRKRGILDLAGGLLERDLEPSQIVQLCKAGVPRWRFEAFLEKRISRKELLAK